MNLVTRVLVEALPGLGSEEEILAMPRHPWANTQFGVPIAGRDVDMIDAIFEEEVEHTIRLCLGSTAERRGAKSVTALICPVRPKGRFSIMGCSFPMHDRATCTHNWQTTRDMRAGSSSSSSAKVDQHKGDCTLGVAVLVTGLVARG